MAFRVFENANQGANFVITLVTLPICVLVTGIRLAVIIRSGKKMGLEDWFAFAALFPYLAWAIYGLVLVVDVENGTKEIFNIAQFDPDVWKNTIKTGYVLQIFFGPQQSLAKLSLLIFYHRIFSVKKTFVYLTYVVGTIQSMYCVAWVFTSIFMCDPPAKTWEPLMPGRCLDLSLVLATTESINSAVDFVMVGMAVYIVRELKTTTSNKWKLGTLFAFGGLTGVMGFVRIGMAYGTVGDSDHVLAYMILQMAASIICCCLPIYRSAFVDLPVLRKLRSRFRSAGGTNSRGADSGGGNIRTIGQKSTREKRIRVGEEWLPLDETCSTQHLATVAWSDRGAEQCGARDAPIMQTLEVRQTVEVV